MHLHSRLSVLSLALAFVFMGAARADTVYNLNATLSNGDIVAGTITFQNVEVPLYTGSTITGYQPGMEVDGDDFTIVDSSDHLVASFLNSYFVGSTLDQPYSELFANGSFLEFFRLEIPGEIPLQNFAGGVICSDTNPCNTGAASSLLNVSDVESGSLTATPEPSSMLLLGTGLLSLAFVAFRKAKLASHLVLHM